MKKHGYRLAQVALVAGVFLVGCKSPFSWGKKDASIASTPQYSGLSGQTAASEGNMFTRGWKSTTNAITSVGKPKGMADDDATNLNSKKGKVTSEVYVEAAAVFESQGKIADAKAQYEQALKLSPKDEVALIGLARIQDNQGEADQAEATYLRCKKAHPKSAVVMNDLGLHYAKKQNTAAAITHFTEAAKLAPTKTNYRNNLATQLVKSEKYADALTQLKAVNSAPIAYYNLACLQNQQGKSKDACDSLRTALSIDRSMVAASQMLTQIEGESRGAYVSAPAPQQPPTTFPTQNVSAESGYYTSVQDSGAVSPVPSQGPYGGQAPTQSGPYSTQPPASSGVTTQGYGSVYGGN